jgi:hypothetical protein
MRSAVAEGGQLANREALGVEAEAFWCFAALMERMESNFSSDSRWAGWRGGVRWAAGSWDRSCTKVAEQLGLPASRLPPSLPQGKRLVCSPVQSSAVQCSAVQSSAVQCRPNRTKCHCWL